MARTLLSYPVKVTASGAANQTLAQIIAATNTRTVIKSIELMPFGATGAEAPLEFVLSIQDDSVGMTADSGAIVRVPPVGTETIQTTTTKYNAAPGPTTSTIQQRFSLHQQGVRKWIPQHGEFIILGGKIVGVQLVTSGFSAVIALNFELEE